MKNIIEFKQSAIPCSTTSVHTLAHPSRKKKPLKYMLTSSSTQFSPSQPADKDVDDDIRLN